MSKGQKERSQKTGKQTIIGGLVSIIVVNAMMPFIMLNADPDVLERVDPNGHLDRFRFDEVGHTDEEVLEIIADRD